MAVTFDVDGADGVTGIDLHLHDDQVLAAYVIADTQPVVIEPGHPIGNNRLMTGLDRSGVPSERVSAAVCSHIHLDHAGGAAALATRASELDVYIHERTADHLIDPEQLVDSSREVMGDAFADVGAPNALDETYLVRVDDGASFNTGDRTLELIHSPGHAPDHLAVWDEMSGTLFAGESFGNYWPKADQWLPPATLPRFDVDKVQKTLSILRSLDPERICLAHFGVKQNPEAAFDAAESALDTFAERIPQIYVENDEDIEATELAVEEELLNLDDYAENLVAMQRRVQTRGFLQHGGLL